MRSLESSKQKLVYIQWLRIFLIVMVVAHHAGQPYGPTGGSWPVSDPSNLPFLSVFFATNAAYFMGFFFLISGYFVDKSYDRSGPLNFMGAKLLRLGVPLTFIVVFLFGLISFTESDTSQSYFGFLWNDYIGGEMDFGPLWFVAHLLIYSGLYTLWRLLSGAINTSKTGSVPGHLAILVFTMALIGSTYFVRQVWPQDVWVRILGIVPLEPMHLPQYASLYVLGIFAARHNWFERLPFKTGLIWFGLGLLTLGLAVFLSVSGTSIFGFVDARIVWGYGDSIICVGMILGLLVLFREFLNGPNRFAAWLASLTYGVYLIHVFLIVAVQTTLVDMAFGATAKFTFVTIVGLAWSLFSVWLLRLIPGARRLI